MSKFAGGQVSQYYNTVRPQLSSGVVQRVLQFLENKLPRSDWQCVADVGCGTGLSLQPYLSALPSSVRVVGLDNSDSQLAIAKQHLPNVQFLADNLYLYYFSLHDIDKTSELPFEPASVDLINVTQAAHWLDLNKFYAQADRALKSGGVLAISWYPLPEVDFEIAGLDVTLNRRVNELVRRLNKSLLDQGYWASQRVLVSEIHEKQNQIQLPYEDSVELWNEESLQFRKDSTLKDFLALFESWSGVRAYRERKPDGQLVDEFYENVHKCLPGCTDDTQLTQVYPYVLLMGRKP